MSEETGGRIFFSSVGRNLDETAVDIGALMPVSGPVPVVIKSLVFPPSEALGRAESETPR